MADRAEAIVGTFLPAATANSAGVSGGAGSSAATSSGSLPSAVQNSGGAMADVYNALLLKYAVPQSSYYPTLLAYLTERCPTLVCAAHFICNLFEGREAEFCEVVEFILSGTQAGNLPSHYPSLWVHFYPSSSSSSYYFNSLCGLSQVKEPKRAAEMYKVREREYSVAYPATKAHTSVFLGPSGVDRKTAGAYTSASAAAVALKAERSSGSGGGSSSGGAPLSPSTSKPGGKDTLSGARAAAPAPSVPVTAANQLYNASGYLPNPTIDDDASSYDQLYASLFAALVVRKYPTRMGNVVAILREHRGRERDLFYQVQSGTLAI